MDCSDISEFTTDLVCENLEDQYVEAKRDEFYLRPFSDFCSLIQNDKEDFQHINTDGLEYCVAEFM